MEVLYYFVRFVGNVELYDLYNTCCIGLRIVWRCWVGVVPA